MKSDDDYSEWDDLKFGIGFPALILATVGAFVFAIVKLFI